MVQGDEGCVSRDVVVLILQKCNVSLKIEDNELTLFKDGIPEVIVMPEVIPRKMLHRFNIRYGVPIELFYNPEMCGDGGSRSH